MDIIVTVLSVVFSGVVATVITILYQKFSGEQTAKRRVFETAVSYRFFISEEENVKSLNSIDVIFTKTRKLDKLGSPIWMKQTNLLQIHNSLMIDT